MVGRVLVKLAVYCAYVLHISATILAGAFSILVAMLAVYQTPPEKRITALQDVLDRGRLSEDQCRIVEQAIERQVDRLGRPDYATWFLYWAIGGTLTLIVAAFFVGLLADDTGKLIFYAFYAAYIAISVIFLLSLASSVYRRNQKVRKSFPVDDS